MMIHRRERGAADGLGRLDKLFPELKLFPSLKDQREAWKKASGTASRRVGYVLVFAGTLFVSARYVAPAAVRLAAQVFGPLSSVVSMFVSIATISVILSVVTRQMMLAYRRRIERSLREQLVEIGVRVCVKCGYSLEYLTSGRCPECGLEFEEGDDGAESGTGGRL